jgi:acyl carrier protein
MERQIILNKLTIIFRAVFNDPTLELKDDLSANDVENWGSLTHMLMIAQVEDHFNIKFRLKDLNKMKMVGDLVDLVLDKTK